VHLCFEKSNNGARKGNKIASVSFENQWERKSKEKVRGSKDKVKRMKKQGFQQRAKSIRAYIRKIEG
jgi:hypothetical protein